MGITEKTFEVSLPLTEYDAKAALITVPNVKKETVSPKISLSDLLQKRIRFIEIRKSLHCSYNTLNEKMGTHKASGSTLLTDRKLFQEPSK